MDEGPGGLVTAHRGQAMMLILTSAEHMFWNVPRRVTVVEFVEGQPPLAECAVLHVPDSEPDGPMWVVAASRYGDAWSPGPDGFPVMIWQFTTRPGPEVVANGRFHPPTAQPQAWCTVQSVDDEGER